MTARSTYSRCEYVLISVDSNKCDDDDDDDHGTFRFISSQEALRHEGGRRITSAKVKGGTKERGQSVGHISGDSLLYRIYNGDIGADIRQ